MKILIARLSLVSVLAAGTAVAQQAPFNQVGVTMGHWHFAWRDIQANKKIFVAMRGTPLSGGNESVQFPGVRINLTLGNTPGSGGSVGSVANHVGFIVKNVQEQTAEWKAAGVPVLPGGNNRLDQAFAVTPDGVLHRNPGRQDAGHAEPRAAPANPLRRPNGWSRSWTGVPPPPRVSSWCLSRACPLASGNQAI